MYARINLSWRITHNRIIKSKVKQTADVMQYEFLHWRNLTDKIKKRPWTGTLARMANILNKFYLAFF